MPPRLQDRQYGFGYEADSQARAAARRARYTAQTARSTKRSSAARARPTTRRSSMYTSARAFYVQFPRLEAGDVVELRYRVDDVTPRNEFADYFGEVVPLQAAEPLSNAEYVLDHAEVADVLLRQPPSRASSTRQRVTATQRIHRFIAETVPPLVTGAGDAAARRGARASCTSRPTELGRPRSLVLGPGQRSVRSRRRDAEARPEHHARAKTERARQGRGRLRLGDPEHALRRARVRHLRLQAAALRANGRARLGRLQRQGDA